MNQVDQLLTNFGAFLDAVDWLGVVDVEMPAFESLSETMKGAGIAGEVNSPVKGHYGAQTVKLNWRTVTPDAARLSAPKVHSLDFRGNQQLFNPLEGYVDQEVVVKVRCVPMNFSPGKFSVGAATETANEFEVHYIQISVAGKVTHEYDKFNFVCIINGVDALETVRKNIGR